MRIATGLALMALCCAAPALAQQQAPTQPTIAVTGTGEALLKPDFARLTIAAVTRADTVPQASEQNRAATERVLARLQGLGVKREDIKTANLQVYETPRLGSQEQEARTPRFTVNHSLEITTRDLNGVSRLVGEILATGDITFQFLSWELDRQHLGEDEARRRAVEDARRQAEVYASAAGVKLGRLAEIRDGSAQRLEAQNHLHARAAPMAAGATIPILPPAEIRTQASVQMVWDIAP